MAYLDAIYGSAKEQAIDVYKHIKENIAKYAQILNIIFIIT